VPNPENTIELHPAANPSRPSVKFTALLNAIIDNIDSGTKNILRSKVKFSPNIIFESILPIWNIENTNVDEIINCKISFSFAFNPKLTLLLIFKISSDKPINKKPNVHRKNKTFIPGLEISKVNKTSKNAEIKHTPPKVGVFSFFIWFNTINTTY